MTIVNFVILMSNQIWKSNGNRKILLNILLHEHIKGEPGGTVELEFVTESWKKKCIKEFAKPKVVLKGPSLIPGNGGRIQLLEVDPMGGVNF